MLKLVEEISKLSFPGGSSHPYFLADPAALIAGFSDHPPPCTQMTGISSGTPSLSREEGEKESAPQEPQAKLQPPLYSRVFGGHR